jgi:hypothetical protein
VWREVLLVVSGVSAITALIGWVTVRWRPREVDVTRPPGGVAAGWRWIAAGPLEGTFPVERTPHERDVGDAAFVDGFIVGRYVAAGERADEVPVRNGAPVPADLTGGGDDPSGLDGDAGHGFGTADGFGVDDGVDDGFGDEFGFDDGFEDDW